MTISIYSSAGLASDKQLIDMTANETFSFTCGTSDTIHFYTIHPPSPILEDIYDLQELRDHPQVTEGEETDLVSSKGVRLENRLQSLKYGLNTVMKLQQERQACSLPEEQEEQDRLARIQTTQIPSIIEDDDEERDRERNYERNIRNLYSRYN